VPSGGLHHHLRLFLRHPVANSKASAVYGLIGLFPIHTGTPVPHDSLHYTSHRPNTTGTEGPQLLLISKVDKSSIPLSVIGSEQVESKGLLRVEALFARPDLMTLSSAGATWRYSLALPCCLCQSISSDHSRESSSTSNTTFDTNGPFARASGMCSPPAIQGYLSRTWLF